MFMKAKILMLNLLAGAAAWAQFNDAPPLFPTPPVTGVEPKPLTNFSVERDEGATHIASFLIWRDEIGDGRPAGLSQNACDLVNALLEAFGLQPSLGASDTVGRSHPFRNDTLKAQLMSVGKDLGTASRYLFTELDRIIGGTA